MCRKVQRITLILTLLALLTLTLFDFLAENFRRLRTLYVCIKIAHTLLIAVYYCSTFGGYATVLVQYFAEVFNRRFGSDATTRTILLLKCLDARVFGNCFFSGL